MKYWLLIAIFATACASAAPAQPGSPSAAPAPSYADARSAATDAEVRDARRAYRAACQSTHPDGYCECMTGGMAQVLAPAELAVATATLARREIEASAATRAHVEATRAQVDAGCAQFR